MAQGRGAGHHPMLEGRVHIGLSQDNLEQIATRDDVIKTSIRDLSTVAARKSFAATTVAATSHLANLAGSAYSRPVDWVACTVMRVKLGMNRRT